MTEFPNVPDTVVASVREALAPYNVQLTHVEYLNAYSAYSFTFKNESRTRVMQFAYDFKPHDVLIEVTRVFPVTARPVEVGEPVVKKGKRK